MEEEQKKSEEESPKATRKLTISRQEFFKIGLFIAFVTFLGILLFWVYSDMRGEAYKASKFPYVYDMAEQCYQENDGRAILPSCETKIGNLIYVNYSSKMPFTMPGINAD